MKEGNYSVLIDLFAVSRSFYEALGPEISKKASALQGLKRFDPAHPDPVERWSLPITPGRMAPRPAGC